MIRRRAQLNRMKVVVDLLTAIRPRFEAQVFRLGADDFVRVQLSANAYVISTSQTGTWSTAGVVINPVTGEPLPPEDVMDLGVPPDGSVDRVVSGILGAAVSMWLLEIGRQDDPTYFPDLCKVILGIRDRLDELRRTGLHHSILMPAWTVLCGAKPALAYVRSDGSGLVVATAVGWELVHQWHEVASVAPLTGEVAEVRAVGGARSRLQFNASSARDEFLQTIPRLRGDQRF